MQSSHCEAAYTTRWVWWARDHFRKIGWPGYKMNHSLHAIWFSLQILLGHVPTQKMQHLVKTKVMGQEQDTCISWWRPKQKVWNPQHFTLQWSSVSKSIQQLGMLSFKLRCTHTHTKSDIIQVELPHFSLCRVSLWRWNNGTKDGSIIVCPNRCRGQSFKWTKPAAGGSQSLPRFSSLWNFKCPFLCWS